jgi:hypothetical protein
MARVLRAACAVRRYDRPRRTAGPRLRINRGALAGQREVRYGRLLHDVAEVKLTVHREHAILSHHLLVPGAPPRPVSEFVLAGWLVTSRQATGVNWIPVEVRFPHSLPDDTSELHRLFGCTLKFGHDRNELVF